MTVLALIFIGIAVALAIISRILATKHVHASQELNQTLQEVNNDDMTEQEAGDAMWDEAEDAIDRDVYRLLNTTSAGFRWGAIGLAIIAVIIFVTSLL